MGPFMRESRLAKAARQREPAKWCDDAGSGIFFVGIEFGEGDEITMQDIFGFGAQDVSEATGHAGTEIQAERTEDEGDAAGHVLATVLADAFDNGESAAVADGEAFARASGDEKLAGSGAVENSVAGENVAAAGSGKSRRDGDGAAGETFADVIVGFAFEAEGDAFGEKCAEALAGGAVKILADLVVAREAVFAAAHEFAAESGANAAIGILDGLRLVLEPERGVEMEGFLKSADVEGRLLLGRNAIGGRDGNDQERIHSRAGAEAVVPAGEVAEGAHAKLREAIEHFPSERTEVGDDHIGLALKLGAEFFVLSGDADGAGVEMALAGHDAADGEERGGAEAKFVCAENGGEDDVAGKFQASVHAEREARTEASANQGVVRFAQTNFPREAGVLDGG